MTKEYVEKCLFETLPEARSQSPVKCLGQTFENDEKRREYFLEKLRQKLKDPEFRKIEGFPIGSDEDILALSDPPYYTACPNPFIGDFIKHNGKAYNTNGQDTCQPFITDVSEGKRDPIYEHYSYHTKVPHKAVARYINHYTESGDIVLDAFSGSGMTGVAGKFLSQPGSTDLFQNSGERHVILNDLSPYAAFIGHHFNGCIPQDLRQQFVDVAARYRWMYLTRDTNGVERVVNYYVWSDVFICPECGTEIVFFNTFVDCETGQVLSRGSCSSCKAELSKQSLEPRWMTCYDDLIGGTVKVLKQVPVLVNHFTDRGVQVFKRPDEYDLEVLRRVHEIPIPAWVPKFRLPHGDNTSQPIHSHGVTHTHMFFTRRNLISFSLLWEIAEKAKSTFWMFELLGGLRVWTRRSIFLTTAWKQGGTGPFKPSTSGILYMPSISGERNIFYSFLERYQRALEFNERLPRGKAPFISSTGSSTDLINIPSNTIDYVFVDPPFGGNIMYSELNLVFEPWLGVRTASDHEAICNKTQGKDVTAYAKLMVKSFREVQRVLKPGRWATIVFHNSQNVIWNAIQESIQMAGLVIADVRILDKRQGTFKQYTSARAVKQDLVISAYKPNGGLEERFKLTAGTEEGVWDFVRTHLKQLPVFVPKDGRAEVIAERQNYLLFDRMVAFHVQRGVTVPMSASEFYQGLTQRFPERDGMYFLPSQVAEYDKKRMTVREMMQLEIAVIDESSAIQWLKQQLTKKPQTFQEIHPQFLREIAGWQKNEKPLELLELLEQSFLCYDGKGDVPSQIHSYLSTNFKELRNLPKDDTNLRAKAKNRWYVPDPNKAADLEKLRERALLREFEEYRESKQKRLKVFRLEAMRAGFKKAWQEHDYSTIIAVARKIPEKILHEDPKLLMWYDQALTRSGEDA